MQYYLSSLQRFVAIAILLLAALLAWALAKLLFIYLFRLVLKRNKMHDREIALRNARMRIYFDANL